MSKMTKHQKSARKAARTRATNRAMLKRWREVDEPTWRRMDVLLNGLLREAGDVSLRWNPLGGITRKLKHGAQHGTLVGFQNGGRLLKVLVEGYKRPQTFHPGFWEAFVD